MVVKRRHDDEGSFPGQYAEEIDNQSSHVEERGYSNDEGTISLDNRGVWVAARTIIYLSL